MNHAENTAFENAFLLYLDTGTPENLRAFFNNSHRFIGQLCFRFFNDPADVDDVMQIFYLKVYENRNKLCRKRDDNELMVIPWCIRTVLNTAKREFNRKKAIQLREKKAMQTQQNENKEDFFETDSNTLKTALKNLPEKYRVPIYLKYYEEQSYESISLSLGIKQSTLRSILQRGLTKLRSTIKLTTGIVLTEMVITQKLKATEFEYIKSETTSHIFNKLDETSRHVKQITKKSILTNILSVKALAITSTALIVAATTSFILKDIKTNFKAPILQKQEIQENNGEKSFVWNSKMDLELIRPLCNFEVKKGSNGFIQVEREFKKIEIQFPFLRTSEYSYMQLIFWINTGQVEVSANASVLTHELDLNQYDIQISKTVSGKAGKNLCEIIRYRQYEMILLNGQIASISKLINEKEGMLITKYDVVGFNISNRIQIESVDYQFNSQKKNEIINKFSDIWNSRQANFKALIKLQHD